MDAREDNFKERRISEIPHYFSNTLKYNILNNRKATEDEDMIRKTGYFANPDDDSYQSNIGNIQKVQGESGNVTMRTEEWEKGEDTIDIFLSGLRIVLMNEQSNTYYPVLDLNISEVHFEKQSTMKSSRGSTATFLSWFYYNAQLGEWEPLIENFRLYMYIDTFRNKSLITISTDRTLNINLSDVILQNLINTYKMWQKLNSEINETDDDLFKYIDRYQNKGTDKYSVDDVIYRRGVIEETKKTKEDNANNSHDDLASPVSLINLTGVNFEIKNIDEDEEEKDILVYGSIKEPSKVYQSISVQFKEEFASIPKIDLSKLHCNIHELSPDNFVYYGVHLHQMHKVLTVRTIFTFYNQTAFVYVLRVYNETSDEYIINPNEKLPITKNIENSKCSLTFLNENDNWSESFDPIEILSGLVVGKDKTFIAHSMSYTFLSKTRDEDVDIWFNLNLLPPVIVRNCLPFNIDVRMLSGRQEKFILKGEEVWFVCHDLTELFELEIKLDWFEYTTIAIDPRNNSNEIKIKMTDIEGFNLTLLAKIERERAGIELILYNKVNIINYTGLNFEFFTYSKSFRRRIAGQILAGRYLLMARKVSKMSLSYKGSSSKTLSTHTIGYKDDFKIRTRDDQNNITSVYEFVYSTSLDLVTSEKIKTELYSKFIKIYPKYVIVNHLETPLKYRQYQNQSDMKILEPNERQILFWPNDQFPQLLSIKALDTRENVDNSDDNTKWNWTQGTKIDI